MSSKFRAIIDSARGHAPGVDATPPAPADAVVATTARPDATPSPALPDAPAPRRPGRPKGKKTDPAFRQVTAYVKAENYEGVVSELFNHHGRKEFSILIDELLADWLAKSRIDRNAG